MDLVLLIIDLSPPVVSGSISQVGQVLSPAERRFREKLAFGAILNGRFIAGF